MSMHDFGLMSLPATHDHFPPAFLHQYHPVDSERFLPHSNMSSQAPLERFLHPLPSSEHLVQQERRISEVNPRAGYMPRQSLSSPSYSHGFEYGPSALANPAFMHAQRGSSSLEQHNPNVRALAGFDPRPPHAGWTPKEEVDEEEQTRELLGGAVSSGTRSPADSHASILQSPTEPRDGSHSPGTSAHSPSSASKTYSFVSLPGNAVRKRPRRRYDEIERLYACSWPECNKAYGTLNHLNAHVSMQRHGQKRSPAEFKELRKQWRQQKKQESATTPPARRRRGTEPALSLQGSGDVSANIAHRLSLGDIRYPAQPDDVGPSPTSTASDSGAYWADSPTSPEARSGLQQEVQHGRSTYAVPLHEGATSRLPPDSTLLTPLPGYRPPSPPPFVHMSTGSALLHPSTLASLSGSPRSPPSPGDPRYGEYEGYDKYDKRRSS